MSYVDLQGLYDRYGEPEIIRASQRQAPASQDGTVYQDAVDKAISDACSLVDSYLINRHEVPLSTPYPGSIVNATAAIARYFLHDSVKSERIRDDYQDAVRYLRDISNGKAKLDIEQADTVGATNAIVVAPDTIFTDGLLDKHRSSWSY